MRQGDDEGADGHQDTTHRDDLWPMEFGPEVTDESYHQQVACEEHVQSASGTALLHMMKKG